MIVDGGARGQAIGKKLAEEGVEVVMSPGSPGNQAFAESTGIEPTDIAGQLSAAVYYGANLTVVGADDPLAGGIVDMFKENNKTIFGPTRNQARIEWDKNFAKRFAKRRRIPVADSGHFTDKDAALEYAQSRTFPLFLKDNGLAQGKGVQKCNTSGQLESALKQTSREFIIEDNIRGPEISHHAFCDGRNFLSMPFLVRDHKYLGTGDTGPMTGGMGAIGPIPGYTEERAVLLGEQFVEGVVKASKFEGMLFTGLKGEIGQEKALEWNARFGDPEAQVYMSLMKSDLLPLLRACAEGDVSNYGQISWLSGRTAVCLVLAAEGYPSKPKKGSVIEGIAEIDGFGVDVIHAGTSLDEDGNLTTSGGRVLNIVSVDDTPRLAIDKAYAAAQKVTFDGKPPVTRSDIGASLID